MNVSVHYAERGVRNVRTAFLNSLIINLLSPARGK